MKKELFLPKLLVLAIVLFAFIMTGCAVNSINAADDSAVTEDENFDPETEIYYDDLVKQLESGTLTRGSTITTTKTIVIKKNTHRDFKNATIICKGMGDGSQSESQKPAIKLEKGASISNVTIGKPAVDGIHCYGNNKLKNVKIPDIGEDAFSVKGEGTVEVNGGYANKGSDKVFQVNKPCTLKIYNFKSDTMGKFVRQNGGKTFKVTVYFDNVTLNNVKEAVGRTDSSSTRFYYRNLKVSNFKGKKGWWYGRDSQAKKY